MVTANLKQIIQEKNNNLIQLNTIITQKENELNLIKEERLMLIGEIRFINQLLESAHLKQTRDNPTLHNISETNPEIIKDDICAADPTIEKNQ